VYKIRHWNKNRKRWEMWNFCRTALGHQELEVEGRDVGEVWF
jgi:hypothetical protein